MTKQQLIKEIKDTETEVTLNNETLYKEGIITELEYKEASKKENIIKNTANIVWYKYKNDPSIIKILVSINK